MLKTIIRNFIKILWILPVDSKMIVFRSTHGTKYNCNPKYICKYILNNYPKRFKIIWLFDGKNIDSHKYLVEKGIRVFNQKSFLGIIAMVTARVLIDNHGIVSYIPLRKKQIVINTWHGGGSYKKEYGNSTTEHKKYMEMMYKSTTAFISSCRKFFRCNLEFLYERSPEKIIEIGMPRNDIFFKRITI